MTAPLFPFSALVGLDELKLALQLAAIDPHLSVLARGDKGAGKSTAARALGPLLAEGAPFVNVPIGTTEDRLLGGLDVERAMKGESALKPGLVSQAHGGVLYIDEVNLLPDHLADALLDAVASGVHVLEREGFSVTEAARFVLVGSMNPEEGALRPQLLDRFALSVDVSAPADALSRRLVVERRLRFDADAAAFSIDWKDEQEKNAKRMAAARKRVGTVDCPTEVLDHIAELICARGVRSLRADLATVRASRALAALEESPTVTRVHVKTVLPLVLGHRVASRPPAPPSPPSATPPPAPEHQPDTNRSAVHERVFAPADIRGPKLVTQGSSAVGQTTGVDGARRGAVIHTRASQTPKEIDARATLVHAIARNGSSQPNLDDLQERVRAPIGGRRFVFVVDASGSHAAQQRMRFVKGAIVAMLDESTRRHDEVVLIAFRGTSANLVLPPTRSVADATTALAYLPTGGRTPLAHALELAAQYVTERATLVLLTDGRANVASRSDDPWADALDAAKAIRCSCLVIDSEDSDQPTGRSRAIADAMRATYVRLADLDQISAVPLIQGVS